jgi:hypothetical protein
VTEDRESDEVRAEGTGTKSAAMFSDSAIQTMKVVQLDKTKTVRFKLKDAVARSGASVTQIDQAPIAAAEAMMVYVANMFLNRLPH